MALRKQSIRRPKRFLTKLRSRSGLENHFDEAETYYREMVSTPGLVLFYKTIRTDAQQVRRWMETALVYQKAEKYKWFQSNEGIREYGELKTTEITKYVEAEEDIGDLSDSIRVMADCEHQLQDIVEALDSRGIMLSKIVDTRNNGNEEVWVDPYRETTNE
jgi:hypothetical protein